MLSFDYSHFDLLAAYTLTLLFIGSRFGWERGVAAETVKTPSQENAEITQRVPQVGCTLCWAAYQLLNLNLYQPLQILQPILLDNS